MPFLLRRKREASAVAVSGPRRLFRSIMRMLLVAAAVILAFGLWVSQPVWVRRGPSVPVADPARLQAQVRFFSETCFPRSFDDATNLQRCAAQIRAEFAAAGAGVTTQWYVVEGTRTCENVIARFGPATGACVVAGAHYDAYGRMPAADDNASGVAVLLELARLLGQDPAPQTPILLVAYCTEEPPWFASPGMGSYRHAKMLRRAGAEVRMMVSIEMVGCFRDEIGSQRYPVPLLYAIYPSRGNYISLVGNVEHRPIIRQFKRGMKQATDLPVWSASLPRSVPGIMDSDHRNYLAYGYPAILLTDTSFYRNANYHRASDKWDTLDYRRMAKVVDGLRGAIRSWSSPSE